VFNKNEFFSMAVLAIRTSDAANGVSKLHGEVSREMWPDHDIQAITNGVHMASWLGREVSKVLGISESRVCQLHARALSRLRSGMARIQQGEAA